MPLTDDELRERMNRFVPPTGILLGWNLLDLDREKGWIRVSFEAKPEFCNPMGHVQGGFIAAMLDDAAAVAVIVKSGARLSIPTLEFKTTFFAPAKVGTLYAEGRCLRLGKRAAFMESELFDPEGKLLARMSVTALPVPMPDNARFVERP